MMKESTDDKPDVEEGMSESERRGVTNHYTGIPPLPKVGEVHFCRNSVDVTARLQTGNPFYIVEGFGRTEEEAEADAWRKLAELREGNGLDVDGSEKVAA